MIYRQHISKASAAACVHSPDVIQALVHASYSRGESCVSCLEDALHNAEQIVADIKAAIEIEKKKLDESKPAPTSAPRTPEEATARLLDYVMFGTPMFPKKEGA